MDDPFSITIFSLENSPIYDWCVCVYRSLIGFYAIKNKKWMGVVPYYFYYFRLETSRQRDKNRSREEKKTKGTHTQNVNIRMCVCVCVMFWGDNKHQPLFVSSMILFGFVYFASTSQSVEFISMRIPPEELGGFPLVIRGVGQWFWISIIDSSSSFYCARDFFTDWIWLCM